MGSDRLYRTEGIVVRRRDQGEADRVLTLCTPLGKLEVIAKGARKVHSRKAGHIELFARAQFVISRVPNSWDVVSQVEMVAPHAVLRSDLVRGGYARYAVELLDRFFAQEEGGAALFDLLEHTLTWLGDASDLDLVSRFYEQQLLGLAGFRPELFRCVGEHAGAVALRPGEQPPSGRVYGFDPDRGGALCPSCAGASRTPTTVRLSAQALWLLQECQRGPYRRLCRLVPPPGVHTEAEAVMQRYITHHLERSVRTGTFLHQLKHAADAQSIGGG